MRKLRQRLADQRGALTAEYATVAVAACGAGGILYQFLTSSAFADLLSKILGTAFKWIFSI